MRMPEGNIDDNAARRSRPHRRIPVAIHACHAMLGNKKRWGSFVLVPMRRTTLGTELMIDHWGAVSSFHR